MQFLTKQFLMTFAGLGLATDMWHPATREACGVSGLRFRSILEAQSGEGSSGLKTTPDPQGSSSLDPRGDVRRILAGSLQKKARTLNPISIFAKFLGLGEGQWEKRYFWLGEVSRLEGKVEQRNVTWRSHYQLMYLSDKQKHAATDGWASFDVDHMLSVTRKGNKITITFDPTVETVGRSDLKLLAENKLDALTWYNGLNRLLG